jgi:hypothetical protein
LDCPCGSSFFLSWPWAWPSASISACGGFFGTETVSWMCVLGAFPFAALGFIKYHGMTAEQFLWAYIKSEFLMPKKLTFYPTNIYYEALKNVIANHEKEEWKRHD